jgi:drug/metabolite transporter (DMT)-like permease
MIGDSPSAVLRTSTDVAQALGSLVSRPLVLFALMSVIWGIPYLFIRIAVAEVSPPFLVMARTGIAAAILLPIALASTDLRPVLARWRWLVAFAAIEIAIPWVLLASAEQKVSSSLAALVIAGVPLVGVAIALLSGRSERMGPIGLIGLLVGIVGVAAIVGGDLESTDPIAIVELGAVAVCYALGPVILARRLSGVPAVSVMSLSLGLTAVVYIPFAALQWPTAVPSPAVLGSIVTLAIVCTAIAFLVFAALIDAVGPVRSTVITYINPAVAALLGVVVLNETLTPAMIAGFALVTLGSVLATRPPRQQADAVPAVTPTG